jgi:glycerophosphoryl diester phosphodiesterase
LHRQTPLAFATPKSRRNAPIIPLKRFAGIDNHDSVSLQSTIDRSTHDVLVESKVADREKSLVAKLEVDPNTTPAHRPHVIGHRGALYRELENTLQSFKTSHDLGCDAVELDVFLAKCGELIVFHGGGTDQNPGCLRDYMNLDASIADFTAADARTLAFNPHYEEFGCGPERIRYKHETGLAYIPTLREVLVELRDSTDLKITIELKGEGTEMPALALVEELDMVGRCQFSSFHHSRINAIRELRPHRKQDGSHVYRTAALFADNLPEDFVAMALGVGASSVHLKYDTATKSRIDRIHAAGMSSMIWMRGPIGMREDTSEKYHDVGDEDEAMYRTIMATGVQAMCINKPDLLVEMIGRRADKLEIPSIAGGNDSNSPPYRA